MPDTDKLRNYVFTDQPVLDGNDRKYLRTELMKIDKALSLIVTTMKQLETRMIAHGI